MTISRWRSGALRPSEVNREILENRFNIPERSWDLTQAPPTVAVSPPVSLPVERTAHPMATAPLASLEPSAPFEPAQARHAAPPAPRPPAVPLPLPLHSFIIRKVQARAAAVGREQATAELLERGMHAETIAVALAAPAPGPFVPR